ncbi:MAG: polymorphic toxin type 23 domain-containing protein [Bacteroidota bacterium]
MRFINSFVLLMTICFMHLEYSFAQEDSWKIHLQFTTNLGSPENNMGCKVISEYFPNNDVEIVLAYELRYHLSNFGPPINHLEHGISGTVNYVWGDRFEPEDSDLSYIKFMDSRRFENSVGYTWQRFFNGIGTSQNVGNLHMRFNKTVTQFSNDVFANTNGKDRYRSGGFAFGFYEDKTLFLTKILIWTGDSHCKEMRKVRDTEYPARWGYRDITDCNYGRLSHGIFSLGVIRDVGYGQTVGGQIGWDSEQIRNFVQNKIFHDLYFIPRFMNKTKNLHLPMKTTDGENYLFEEGQEVRRGRFVWQFSLNPSSLY